MIRQLGPASLFCSFSSAETHWIHLLRILGQLVDNKVYSNIELENMSWDGKCRLIQSDLVICAGHFDYQISQFLTNFGIWKTIKKQLNDLKEGEFITFGELLLKLKLTENSY